MHTTQEFIGIIAGILSIAGYVPYIISILRGKTRPNRASWLIWTIVGGLLAFSFMATGDKKAIWVPLGYFIGPFITALLSIRYGYSIWSTLDTACVLVAALSVIPWFFSHNANVTLLINIAIDMTGAIPTVIKSYHEPETEDFTAWLIFFAANTLELFAITSWNIAAIYPIYLFFLAGSIVIFTLKGKLKSHND